MMRILAVVSIVLFCHAAFTPQALGITDRGPRIEVAEGRCDFQDVQKGLTKEVSVLIRNAGDRDLAIEKIDTCCGYEALYISSWTVSPGASALLKFACDSSKKPLGPDEKTIVITSNDPVNPHLDLKVCANIVEKAEKVSVASAQPPQVLAPYISAQDLHDRRSVGETIILLDVREPNEFSEKHIPGAINCPKSGFRFNTEEELLSLVRVDRKPPIAVYCGGGYRSSYIAGTLVKHGYNAYNLQGGFASWVKEGYPVKEGPRMPASTEPLAINLEEAYGHYFMLFKGNVVWVDVRSPQLYEAGHIQNALNIPANELEQKMASISQDKEVVFYCSGAGCEEADDAARMLIKNGFKQARIKVFQEGYSVWEDSGYPIEKGPPSFEGRHANI